MKDNGDSSLALNLLVRLGLMRAGIAYSGWGLLKGNQAWVGEARRLWEREVPRSRRA